MQTAQGRARETAPNLVKCRDPTCKCVFKTARGERNHSSKYHAHLIKHVGRPNIASLNLNLEGPLGENSSESLLDLGDLDISGLEISEGPLISANLERINELEASEEGLKFANDDLQNALNVEQKKADDYEKLCDSQAMQLLMQSEIIRVSKSKLDQQNDNFEQKMDAVKMDAERRIFETQKAMRIELDEARKDFGIQMEELISQRDHMENQLMMEMNHAKRRMASELESLKELQNTQQSKEIDWQMRLNYMESELNTIIDDDKETISNLELNVCNLYQNIKDLNSNIDMINHDLNEARSVVQSKDDEIDRLQTLSMDLTNKLEITKQKLSSLNKKLEEDDMTINLANQNISTLRNDVSALKSENAKLEESTNNLKRAKSDLENKIFLQKEDFLSLHSTYEASKLQCKMDMEKALSLLKNELVSDYEGVIDGIRKQAKIELINAISEKWDQIKEIQNSMKTQELNFNKSLASQNEVSIAEKTDLQSKLNSSIETAKSLQRDFNAANVEINQKLLEISKLKSVIDSLNDQIFVLEVDKSHWFLQIEATDKRARAEEVGKSAIEKEKLEAALRADHAEHMDILRTSLQQQSDQMLQEQESRMQRSHNSSIQALNKKYHEELKIERDKVFTYEKLLNDIKRKLKDQDEYRSGNIAEPTKVQLKSGKRNLLSDSDVEYAVNPLPDYLVCTTFSIVENGLGSQLYRKITKWDNIPLSLSNGSDPDNTDRGKGKKGVNKLETNFLNNIRTKMVSILKSIGFRRIFTFGGNNSKFFIPWIRPQLSDSTFYYTDCCHMCQFYNPLYKPNQDAHEKLDKWLSIISSAKISFGQEMFRQKGPGYEKQLLIRRQALFHASQMGGRVSVERLAMKRNAGKEVALHKCSGCGKLEEKQLEKPGRHRPRIENGKNPTCGYWILK